MSITLVQGDTAPILRGTITDDDTGGPLDLTGCTIFFQMKKKDDHRYTINAECDITSANDGLVSYTLATNDLSTAGQYESQFEVHYPDLTEQTTHNITTITVRKQ